LLGTGLFKDSKYVIHWVSQVLPVGTYKLSVEGKTIEMCHSKEGWHVIQAPGYLDSIFLRSKGGRTYSGWECAHLPYLAELDNYGSSLHPSAAGQGGDWVWGYDEISWVCQSK
jgi:hypothetical protein